VSGPRRLVDARWYELRRSHSGQPRTYTCPFCPRKLPAFNEHVLIRPEGSGENRRHAHIACVKKARAAGRLPSRDEWLATQPRRPGWFARLFRRASSR
jgi:hypothetical protein